MNKHTWAGWFLLHKSLDEQMVEFVVQVVPEQRIKVERGHLDKVE
jgi:hypothetical protein